MKKPIPFGKYYLLERISVGGMAEVFKAKAFGVEGFERLIAVKRILPSIAEDEEFITMFIDEAKIAVQLQHANIAQIFDLGKVGDSYFIALEYVSGKDLRTIFERLRNNGQAIPIPMAAYITMKVCEGLDYAHNKKDAAGRDLNLVHRDVSPQNILVSHDGEIKIIDFGIAKAAGKAGKTQAGILKGKFGYMSPEQVRGLPLDRRSDIFAVGICLWELVTGERLFVGESDFSTLEKVRNVEITPPSTYNQRVPKELEDIILKALSKEVEDRYQSAMDFHDDLQSWMYTSGNFFARKDLGQFMYEAFRADIEKEAASAESDKDIIRSTVPPPPKAAFRSNQSLSPNLPGAPPPPPRMSHPPAVPSTQPGGPNRPTPKFPGPPSGGNIAPARPVPPGPRPAPPNGRGLNQPPVKRTMLGMPAPPAPRSGPPSMPSAGGPRGGMVMGNHPLSAPSPMVPSEPPSLAMDDWDDDEPPTNIYTKETAAEMAQAAVALQVGRHADKNAAPPYQDMGPQTSQSISAPRERKRSSVAPAILGVLAAILVLGILGAVFFLKFRIVEQKATLELDVQPADKLSIIIDGVRTLPGTRSPFKINDLTPGSHFLTVKRTGYKELQVEVGLQAGQTVSRSLALERISTGFFLETDPPGASVWVDDRPLDSKTPITVNDLEPGTYRVRIAKGEEYAQKTIEVEIKEGEIKTLPKKVLDLKTVEVTFVTEPPGAKATLMSGSNREEIGTTPTTARIDTAKEYKVKYSKDGYTEVISPIEYAPGQHKVTLSTITLWQKKSLPPTIKPKTTKVAKTIRPPKTDTEPRTPDVEPDDEPEDTGSGEGKMGTLSVQTRPWSKVYINGKFIKNTPLVNYKLRAGSYRITVENPNYNIKKNFRATIKPGKQTTLVKTLI